VGGWGLVGVLWRLGGLLGVCGSRVGWGYEAGGFRVAGCGGLGGLIRGE